MDELIKIYTRRYNAVMFLLNHTEIKTRIIELNERKREILRVIYEIRKINKNGN
jgi:uncharacterized membrane protein YqjE